MSQNIEIKVALKLKHKPISVNALYKSRVIYQGGKPRAAMYKVPEAAVIEKEIFDQLRAVDWTPYMEFLRNTKKFSLLLQFVFIGKPSKKIDADNHIKHVQDCLCKFIRNDLGITSYDDCLNVEVHAYKSFIEKGSPGSNNMVFIQFKESHFNMNFNQIEKPEKVYLPDPDDALKKFLKKEKFKIARTPDKANTVIHLISGPITPVRALEIDNLIDEAEKFCYIGITGSEEPDPETMIALEQRIGGKSTIRVEWIGKEFNKISEWIKSF